MQDLLELYETRENAARLTELHELVAPVLEDLQQKLGYERAMVLLVDQDERTIQGAVGINVPDDLLGMLRLNDEETPGPILEALSTGRPIRVDDALRDGRIVESNRAYYAMTGMLSFAAIPLLPASCVLVVSKGEPITEAEINELLPYAGRIVVAVEGRSEAKRVRETGEQHAIEKEWLWWMLNAVHEPIVLSDEQNNVVLYNIHAERLLKPNPDDSPGKRRAIELNNFLLAATISSFILDQGAAAMGRELTLVDPIEGAELLFEVICQPSTNLRTGERGLVSVLKNVTDLRRAADQLQRTLEELSSTGEEAQRERDRLNLILRSVADPIVVTDAAGEIILMNQPAEHLLQPARSSRARTSSPTLLANEAKLSTFISQLRLEATAERRGEIQLFDPDTGENLTMSVTATEVADELGQVTAIVSVLHDLTKIRELERRTLEQQLFESEKLAAVGRLAATVAHEINNPLEAIKNALYLVISNSQPGDPNARFLEIASKETSRVSGIVHQMLGFFRPTVVRDPTDVNLVVRDCTGLLERELRRHGVHTEMDLLENLPRVLASADQLKQVFLNLILNAQQAMPDGGTIRISTWLSRETDTEFLAGRYVLVQIEDTGTGILEEHLPHIFEPFYTTKEARGTGLGLWVSHGIIQNLGGQIQVRSRLGQGTTFTIALPPEGSA
jgi:PAS domain S-box-containing protein